MANEMKTTAIPAMLEKAEETGLITQESLDALEAKRRQAGEQIRNLLRKRKERIISAEYMKAEIETIQQGLQDRINVLEFSKALESSDDEEILT